MNWEIALALIGAIGGLEFIKWIVNRKPDSRMIEAEADSKEFHVLQETVEFLQEQLQTKEERFAEQTQLVRKQNRDILDLERKVAELEIEMVQVRCNDHECPWRKPPTARTPPKPNISKNEYHTKRKNETDAN